MYRITLSNGITIENLNRNGNNYVSKHPLSEDLFTGNLDTIYIDGDDGSYAEYHFVRLVQLKQYGNEWWFILAEKTPEEIRMENLEAATRQIMLTMAGGMSHV